MFQYKQSRKKLKSLWGKRVVGKWSALLGSLTLNPQGVGWACTASMAREDGTKNDTVHGPVIRGRGLQLSVGTWSSHWWGAIQAPLSPG